MNQAGISRWVRWRMLAVILVFSGLMVVVGRRAYLLQAVEGERLREFAEQQYLKETELPPRRGTIYDRNGTPLAVSVEVDSVYANPRVVGQGARMVARRLAATLDLNEYTLRRRLSSRRYFTWIKRRISPQQAKRVRELKIKGVHLTQESRRFYPNHGLGGSVVGFSGADAKGLEGLELAYDGWLRGPPKRIAGLRDALGRQVFTEGAHPVETESHDLQLSLDKFVQFEVEQALADLLPTLRPKTGWAAALVLETHTGDVLGMASVPSFDPNRFAEAKPAHWRNRVVSDTFEPGSTMKIFSVAAAMDQGLTRPGEVFDCERGRWRVGRHVIHDSHAHGKLDLRGVLQKSSNVGVSKLAFRLGKPGLYHALKKYGFGAPTGAKLPGERGGVVRPHQRWSDIGLTNVAFGQGMTTTVLQLGQALTAVANGGVMMQPRLVQRIRDRQGETVKSVAPQGRRVMSQTVADQLRSMLVSVTEKGGTGHKAALDRYTVAGKTGTAQKVDPVTRAYSKDLWVASFMGVVPASRPRLAIVVVVNEPDGEDYYGGQVAGPVFKRVAEKTLAYLGVQPDKEAPSPEEKKGRKTRPGLVQNVEPEDVLPDIPPPLPGKGERPGDLLVPDFTGMSMAEVLTQARKLGLSVELLGSGRAVAQSPGPGPALRDTPCRVSFAPPG